MLKKIFSMFIALIVLMFISGCSKNVSPSKSAGSQHEMHKLDVYQKFSHPEVSENEKRHISSESLSEWTPLEESRKVAIDKAKAFCAETNTTMIVMQEHVANLPYLINHSPRVELSFVCHDMNKKKKKIVHVRKESLTAKPEVQKTSVIKDKYSNLIVLKKLLDDGTLTQKEFDSEKKKLLEEQ